MKDTYKSFIVPAGKYWLADPCYIVTGKQGYEDWSAYCFELAAAGETAEFALNGYYADLPDGTKVLSFSTAHGDGHYHDQLGTGYSVDSGLLGLVPYEYKPDYSPREGGGQLIEFSEETLCFTRDGILTFGSYIIDTAAETYGTDGMEL